MSNAMMTRAFETDGLSSPEKFVLVALADQANDSDADNPKSIAWPSVGSLCDRTALSRATVFRSLDSLEQKGLIKRTDRRRENGSQRSNEYSLNLPEKKQSPTVRPTESHSETPHRPTVRPLEPSDLIPPKNQSPLRGESQKEEKRITWITPFYDVWSEIYKGEMPTTHYVAQLKRLLNANGLEVCLRRWRNCLTATPFKYITPTKFFGSFGLWDDPQGRSQPAQQPSLYERFDPKKHL